MTIGDEIEMVLAEFRLELEKSALAAFNDSLSWSASQLIQTGIAIRAALKFDIDGSPVNSSARRLPFAEESLLNLTASLS